MCTYIVNCQKKKDYFPRGVSGFPLMHQNCANLAAKISEIVFEDGTIQFCSLVDYIYVYEMSF